VEVEGSLLIRWTALYALASVWMRGERENTCARLLASPRQAEWGVVWCGGGEAMGVGARRAHE
jgi:hypothetical protein